VALTLAVLQKNLIPRTEALDFLQNPLELTFTINPQKNSNPETFHILLNNTVHMNWPYFLLAAVLFLGAFFSLRHLKRRFYKNHTPVRSKLIFQFSSESGTAVVPIKSFPRLSSDLKLSNINTLRNFELNGQIFPVLSYQWEAVVFDRVGKGEIRMPVRLQIPFWSAQTLKQIFRQKFDIQILLKCDHNFSKILVATQVRAGPAPFPPNRELEVIQV